MKTVGDFKANGWAIVNGDQVRGCDGFVGKVMCCKTFNETIQFDKEVIVEFAWRTNTGVKPEFVGRMEFECRNGHILDSDDFGVIDWVIDGHELDIIKWRPHLPKVEDKPKSPYDVGAHVSDASKPVYTQAMCNAGDLPPVGSEFKVDGDEDCDDGYCHLRCVAHHADGGVIGQDDSARMFWIIAGAMPIDTRTPKQKAVDEMVSIAIESKDDIAKSIIYEACVKLVSAGYRKH